MTAHVVMLGSTVRAVFTNTESNGNNAEGVAQGFAGQLAISSADDPQEDARDHGIWIARVELNPQT